MSTSTIVTPLYGHTSPETAFLVADYPYGRTVRCRIRYWLECDARRGYRFVSQTENPKTLTWNKPKPSTYVLIAAGMYLDDDGHVQWKCVTEYTDAAEALAFARAFPGSGKAAAERLLVWAAKKAAFAKGCADGKVTFTINGETKPWSEIELQEHAAEALVWADVVRAAQAARGAATPNDGGPQS